MALIETEALVLRSYNLSDADKIVIFMTENSGLIRGVAKGAKRLRSKFGGSLETLTIVSLTYFQKEDRELVSVREIEMKKSYLASTSDIHFLQKFSYLSELLIEFSPPHDPNQRLYNMAKICLQTASDNYRFLDAISLYFELWVLRLGGFLPVWSNCYQCQKEFSNDIFVNLQMDFQVVCHQCQNIRRNSLITPEQRFIFSVAQKVSPQKFVELTADHKESLTDLSLILKRIIARVLDKKENTQKGLIINYPPKI
jgi:DNA repair protein RecO (recombination protein O)